MTNPFSVLDGKQAPRKKSAKKAGKKKNVKKNTKVVEKKKPQVPMNVRKPRRVLLVPEAAKEKTETTEPVEANRNFDGPDALKNYKRDGSKGYFNRKPGQPSKGKRYNNRDRSVDRSGRKFQRFGKTSQEGRNYAGGKASRYLKKKPQEMNDEEWEKQLKVDAQKQKNEAQKAGKAKKKKKVVKKNPEEKKSEDKTVANTDAKKSDKKKRRDGDRKKKPRKDFRKKEREDDIVFLEQDDDESDDEGKETYEDFIKNRKQPVNLIQVKERKAREGVKIQAQQLQYTRKLSNKNADYMKVSLKKPAAKTTSAPSKKKKKKSKTLSTSDFFKGNDSASKKKNNSKFRGKKGGNKKDRKAKKNNPDFKDKQSFPTLS